ncbi:hypothetical protein [Micromonospora sp. NPDC000668]|uniref:hypothetical protein n=1 Tax=Micromonospora sp. NPDC000668 TaxID=3364219 RepID=UPI0036CA1635
MTADTDRVATARALLQHLGLNLICMPGVTHGQVDAFVADLTATAPPQLIPRPRARRDGLSIPSRTL